MSSTARKVDFILYILIGAAVIGLAFVLAFLHVANSGVIKWGGLVVGTSIVYGGFIYYSRSFIHRGLFWALTLTALLLHLAAFIAILIRVNEWKLLWFMVVVLEVPILCFLRDKCLPHSLTANNRCTCRPSND